MQASTLRNTALSAFFGATVALSVMVPGTAFADNQPQSQDGSTPKAQETTQASSAQSENTIQFSSLLLDNCSSIASQASAENVTALATSLKGCPYAYGGTTPRGFDCSGFTQYCFKNALGISLPRSASAQSALGTPVSMDNLQTGDLLFWGSGSGVYHVGIYLENGTYIHAAGSGKGVQVQTMEYFHPSFAKRIC